MSGWLLLLGVAAATSPEEWASLNAARLASSLDRDPQAAVAIYETLLKHQHDEDPTRGKVLYWMGRALAESGEDDASRVVMDQVVQIADWREAARTWQGEFALARRPVVSLPYVERFETDPGHVVRGWPQGSPTDLTVDHEVPGIRFLRWRSEVRDGEEDDLVVGLQGAATRLRTVRITTRSEGFEAWIQVSLLGADGRSWSTPAIQVPTSTWRDVSLGLDDFYPSDPSLALVGGRPGRVVRVHVREVTASYARERGEHALLFDTLELRAGD